MTYKNIEPERIAKVIARIGYCSKREAEQLIKEGKVKVNGKVITSPALNVTDESIKINNKLINNKKERTRLWLYHKPKGCVVSTKTEKKIPTVFELLPKKMPRVISIGRLDINTEGLLLLTNNGELANYITHPKNSFVRTYRVRVYGKLNKERFKIIEKYGVVVNGMKYKSMKIVVEKEGKGTNSWLRVSLKEGKNREIKNIMGELGLKVTRLIRVAFGPFQLNNLLSNEVKEIPYKDIKNLFGDKINLE